MIINATAKLMYWSGDSVVTSPERLEMIVKFKYPKKLFKVKIKSKLASPYSHIDYIDKHGQLITYSDYLGCVKNIVEDDMYLIGVVKNMIKDYLKENIQDKNNESKLEDIYKK